MAEGRCPRCSAPFQPGDAFCVQCGRPLTQGGTAAAPDERFVVQLRGDRRYEADGSSLALLRGSRALAAIPWSEVEEVGARMAGGLAMGPRGFPLPTPRPPQMGLTYATFYVLAAGRKKLQLAQDEVLPTTDQRREVERLYPAKEGLDPPYNFLLIRLALARTVALGRGHYTFRVVDELGPPRNPK